MGIGSFQEGEIWVTCRSQRGKPVSAILFEKDKMIRKMVKNNEGYRILRPKS